MPTQLQHFYAGHHEMMAGVHQQMAELQRKAGNYRLERDSKRQSIICRQTAKAILDGEDVIEARIISEHIVRSLT